MSATMSQACACSAERVPYASTAVIDGDGHMHRLTVCHGQPAPAPPASPPQLLSVTCDHGEALWVTGPDPASLLTELGCGCEGRAA